ncbi:MAG: ferrous iron transport protein A [Clostridia bacterium]|nr:ferrous iron transport protein A [Clostridia bacterium]
MNEKCLVDLKINEVAKIKQINIKDEKVKTQLKNLGFIIGEKIKLLKYNYNKEGFLVKVMNVNYAVDRKICEGIIVCE